MRRRSPRVLVALVTIALLSVLITALRSGGSTRLVAGRSATPQFGPLLATLSDGDFGDPFVLAVAPSRALPYRYVVYATANWDQRLPTAVSDDLQTWRDGPDALPTLPGWAAPDPGLRNAWGPAVIALDGRYLLYYATRTRAGTECISIAVAASPLGPFTDRSAAPLVCQPDLAGSIDPSPVLSPDGEMRLVWRSVGSQRRPGTTAIWTQPLSRDGMSLRPGRMVLLRPTLSWERGVVEGPSMTRLGGRWWLFFSANSYRTNRYATGVAACASVAGPCTAAPSPVLHSTSALRGPGGLEVFHDFSGHAWGVFHTWRLPSEGNPHEREIHLIPMIPPAQHSWQTSSGRPTSKQLDRLGLTIHATTR